MSDESDPDAAARESPGAGEREQAGETSATVDDAATDTPETTDADDEEWDDPPLDDDERTDARSALIGAGIAAAISAIVLIALATAEVGTSTVRIVAAIAVGVVAARAVEYFLK